MILTKTARKIQFVALAVLPALGAVLFAQSRKGDYAPSQLGSLQQVASVQINPDANYAVSPYPAPAPDLALGDGLQDVRIHCGTCHSPRYITMQPPLPPATWEAEVNKMNKAFGANIPEENSHKIIGYLQSHYSTGNRR